MIPNLRTDILNALGVRGGDHRVQGSKDDIKLFLSQTSHAKNP